MFHLISFKVFERSYRKDTKDRYYEKTETNSFWVEFLAGEVLLSKGGHDVC